MRAMRMGWLLVAAWIATGAQATPAVVVAQGGVARWAGLDARECGFLGKRYPAVDGACYYPVDLRAKVGVHEIALYDSAGKQHLGAMTVEKVDFPEVRIDLPDDTYLNVSAGNQARHKEERARVLALFKTPVTPVRFSLPLAKPAKSMPPSENDFGSRRVFADGRTSQHTGRDAPVTQGSTVRAVADGTVLLAEEHFYTGNTVFIDHGGGLMSMNFHLSKIAVDRGDDIKRGQVIGTVGSTGRSTGPHLHLGLRWLGARIDPYLLLDTPTKLPSVGDSPAKAEAKIEAAREQEPEEDDAE
ncbi:M23 family metallopeptidase [Tahibacter amnicola]|uniref:M23 family metallopeptidase n=1 Tax=Tahibacter amnicola TaxID=2976241 RepID=A0ABY6BLY0_9GAMM|nr:M23 family metallopeptidase [Tahibacter amnicola]UXI70453.1 M23 family metallopeptidase [Tahibacter amnicola]